MDQVHVRRCASWLGTLAVWFAVAGCLHRPEAFYPVGIYAARTTNDQASVRLAGFNLVAGPAEKGYLDSARRLGLKVLAAPGTFAGPKFSAQRARQAVVRFDSHPALWAWYLIDEPDLHRVSPGDVKRAHGFFKRIGARKPTALVLYQGGEAVNYATTVDLVLVDRYPIPWLPLANFPQHMRLADAATRGRRPLIAVIQAFDWRFYPELLPGKSNLRPPTYSELRCMTYCALARNAAGLFYYCYDDGTWKMSEHPEVWRDLQIVVAEVNERRLLFQARHRWWPYQHKFPNSLTGGFNAALEPAIIPALLNVPRGNAAVPEGNYLLAVNTTDQELTYQVTLPQLSVKPGVEAPLLPVFGEARSVPVAGGWLQDTFGPFAVHIYGPMPAD